MIPKTCPIAKIKLYGGDDDSELNGLLVHVAGYDRQMGWFLVELVSTPKREGWGSRRDLLCLPAELVPQNEYCQQVMDSLQSLPDVPVELRMTEF